MAQPSLAANLWSTYRRAPHRDAQFRAEREALIVGHLWLVEKIARTQGRTFRHVELEELIGAGHVGLIEAADRWQPGKGKFEAFAYFRVMGAIVDSQKRREYKESLGHSSLEGIAAAYDGWLPADMVTCPAPLPDEILDRKRVYARLAAAVQSLPPADAALLRLWMDDAPVRDQCRISGMSAGYTRDRLEQLIGRVRAIMLRPEKSAERRAA